MNIERGIVSISIWLYSIVIKHLQDGDDMYDENEKEEREVFLSEVNMI